MCLGGGGVSVCFVHVCMVVANYSINHQPLFSKRNVNLRGGPRNVRPPASVFAFSHAISEIRFLLEGIMCTYIIS